MKLFSNIILLLTLLPTFTQSSMWWWKDRTCFYFLLASRIYELKDSEQLYLLDREEDCRKRKTDEFAHRTKYFLGLKRQTWFSQISIRPSQRHNKRRTLDWKNIYSVHWKLYFKIVFSLYYSYKELKMIHYNIIIIIVIGYRVKSSVCAVNLFFVRKFCIDSIVSSGYRSSDEWCDSVIIWLHCWCRNSMADATSRNVVRCVFSG